VKILISGASGLIGRTLGPRLLATGHEVRSLSRGTAKPGSISWNVETGEIDQRGLDQWGGLDAVVHLAGESIAQGRWTGEKKRRIHESRVETTERLAAHLLKCKPKVFISASAIGFYGNRLDEVLTEDSPGGTGFLADTCEAWESAAQRLVTGGVRVIYLRSGMILSREGGALAKMLPIFRAGLGGQLGSGRQWVSWITLEDVVRAIEFFLHHQATVGAYNLVAPQPVRNRTFTTQLGRVLHRPTFMPAPAFALRLAFGEMAYELLLSSQRVIPERLQKAGFEFRHPELPEALQYVLYKS
jgi:uncharacterized protein (TIGR01777 family)